MSEILNCGQGKQESELVRFTYQCPEQWDNLKTTANESVRFCDACQEQVFYCTDKQEADQHARQGHCIAIASRLAGEVYNQYTPMMLEYPDTNGYWGQDIFNNPKHWLVETIRNREMRAVDLNHSDLSNVDLSGTDLSNTNLRNTNLNGSNLSNANLSQANLRDANLSGANLSNANLTNTNLIDANLSQANLSGVELNYALKNEFSWSRVNLDGVTLEPRHQASYLNGKGRAFIFGDRSNTRPQAIDYLQQALSIRRKLGDRQQEVQTLYHLVNICIPEDRQKAREFCQQLLSIVRESGEGQQEAQTLDKLATLYGKHSETRSEIDLYQQALAIKIELGDYSEEARTLSILGQLHLKLKEKSKAFEYFQQALAKSDGLKNSRESNNNLYWLIRISEDLGNKQELLINYYLRKSSNQPAAQVSTFGKIGNLYLELGREGMALEYFLHRIKIIEKIQKSQVPQILTYHAAEIYVLKLIINIYEKLNDASSLLKYYHELLEILRNIGGRPRQEASFNELTQIYLKGREKQQPPEIIQNLLELRTEEITSSVRKQNPIDLCIGKLYLEQDQIPQAIDYLQQGLTAVSNLRKQRLGRCGYCSLKFAHNAKQQLLATIDRLNQSSNQPLYLPPYCQHLLQNREKSLQLENKILSRINEINAQVKS